MLKKIKEFITGNEAAAKQKKLIEESDKIIASQKQQQAMLDISDALL